MRFALHRDTRRILRRRLDVDRLLADRDRGRADVWYSDPRQIDIGRVQRRHVDVRCLKIRRSDSRITRIHDDIRRRHHGCAPRNQFDVWCIDSGVSDVASWIANRFRLVGLLGLQFQLRRDDDFDGIILCRNRIELLEWLRGLLRNRRRSTAKSQTTRIKIAGDFGAIGVGTVCELVHRRLRVWVQVETEIFCIGRLQLGIVDAG